MITSPHVFNSRIRTTPCAAKCADCPPDRVCAWACQQGASMDDIVIGFILDLEGKLGHAPLDPAAGGAQDSFGIWDYVG